MPAKNVVLLCTGGTIACTQNAQGDLVPTLSADQLGECIASRVQDSGYSLVARDIAQLDSSSLTLDDLHGILCQVMQAQSDPTTAGIILIHGTDSMEETAMALSRLIAPRVPIVVTGAQYASDSPSSDGPANLTSAVQQIVAEDNSGSSSITVAFGDKILSAYGVRKVDTQARNAFANPVEQADIPPALVASDAQIPRLDLYRVDIVSAYPGSPEDLMDHSIELAQGIVVEAMGSGNVGTSTAQGIRKALSQGIPVVISTRVPDGPVAFSYGGAGGGAQLAREGVRSAGLLSSAQARMELLCMLACAK